jgi:16S rRNA (cytidine1402-2'-O)-methyltransferase
LEDLALAAPDRSAAVARELTKVHEEFKIGTLNDLAVYYREHTPRGEVTVVLEGCGPDRRSRAFDHQEVEHSARTLLDQGLSRKDVARLIVEEFDLPRNEAYRFVNDL